MAVPEEFGRYRESTRRKFLESYLAQYGCWGEVLAFEEACRRADAAIPARLRGNDHLVGRSMNELMVTADPARFSGLAPLIAKGLQGTSAKKAWERVEDAHHKMEQQKARWRYLVPAFHWHGTQNQYHKWWVDFLYNGGGCSWADERKQVLPMIWKAIGVTLPYTIMALLITFLLGIGAGYIGGRYAFHWPDQWLGGLGFSVQAVPSFWLATLIMLECSEWGNYQLFWTNVPASEKPINYLLPVIAYTYGSWAVMGRLIRNRLLEIGATDFMRTARAKGLGLSQATWKHGLPHTWTIVATLLGGSLPGLIAGSVVVEAVFGIDGGVGTLILSSIFEGDIPVMMGIFTLTAMLTVLGYLLSDLLYVLVNPQMMDSAS